MQGAKLGYRILKSGIIVAGVLSAIYSNAESNNIQQIKHQLEALKARLERLESKKSVGKIHTQSSRKRTVHSRNDKVKVTMGGQVGVAAGYGDDGKKTGIYHVTNNAAVTRGYISAEGALSNDLIAKAVFEFAYSPNNSSRTSIRSTDSQNDFDVRHADFILSDARLGTFYLGKGATATDDSAKQDLSGTYLATAPNATNGFYFINKNEETLNTASNPKVSDVYDNFDGDLRKQRIRYDTPVFYGLQIRAGHNSTSTSQGPKNTHDAGLFYGAKINGYEVRGVTSIVKNDGKFYTQYTGGGSLLAPFGTNFTFLIAGRNYKNRPGRKNAEHYSVKIGQHATFFDSGKTLFSLDYGQTRNLTDTLASSDKKGTAQLYGATILQKYDQAATEVYLTWRTHKFNSHKTSSKNYHPIHIILLGALLKI